MRRTSFATCLMILISSTLPSSGCKTSETVLIKSGDPMQLMQSVKARVASDDGKGNLVVSQNPVEIPMGWWVMPDIGKKGTGPTLGSPATRESK